MFLSGTGGEVANAQVCKTCIRGFDPRPVLQILGKQVNRRSERAPIERKHELFAIQYREAVTDP